MEPLETNTASRPAPIELELSARGLKAVVANPSELAEDGLVIEAEGQKKRIPYERMDALAVVAIEGDTGSPVIVVDVILNWRAGADEPLRLIRMRSDRFDPCQLVAEAPSPLDAVRQIVGTLLERSDALPLPDAKSARGLPFASFVSLASYQRSVLSVEEDDVPPTTGE
jgi:hypothetical protein